MSSITERLSALLETTEPFSRLTPAQRQDILKEVSIQIHEAGEVILPQGHDIHRALYVVESGLVRLYDDQRNRLVNMAGEGGTFGLYGILQGGILPYEAKAVEPTVCALIPAERFNKLRKENPDFDAYFQAEIKAYVRTLGTEVDAGGAYLLFETSLRDMLNREAVTCSPETTVQEAARRMKAVSDETVLVLQDGMPMGLLTEGDLVRRVVAEGRSPNTPVSALLERPPISVPGSNKLFDAVQVMMRHRIRRVIISNDRTGEDEPSVLGLLTAEDVAHLRGLDPVATVERMEKAKTISELAQLRASLTRRLFRLYQQGVQSEALLDVVAELDDQLKARALYLVEQEVNQKHEAPGLTWAWLAFGAPGRREAALFSTQANGLVYEDPAGEAQAERAATYFGALAARAVEALESCGIQVGDAGISASNEAFRQPLAAWQAAYQQWVAAEAGAATQRAAACFDVRVIYGERGLQTQLRDAIRDALASNPTRFLRLLMRAATEHRPPISFFGQFEVERAGGEREGLNLRKRGLDPIVDLTRVLALEAGYLRSTNTFDRLRHLREAQPDLSREVTALLESFTTLVDIHLRTQMQAAESGEALSDLVDPNMLHKSQQNLLKETFKKVDKVQSSLGKRYERG